MLGTCHLQDNVLVCVVNKVALWFNQDKRPRLWSISLSVSVYVLCNIVPYILKKCLVLTNR